MNQTLRFSQYAAAKGLLEVEGSDYLGLSLQPKFIMMLGSCKNISLYYVCCRKTSVY